MSKEEQEQGWIEWTPETLINLSDFKIAQYMQNIAKLMMDEGFFDEATFKKYMEDKDSFVNSVVIPRDQHPNCKPLSKAETVR
jgi:hypothetical protein